MEASDFSPFGWDVRTTVAIIGMVAAALTLAFFFFLPQSLRLDEAQSLWQVSRSAGAILTTVAQDVHVPLYHELLHVWLAFVGDSVTTARMLSLLFYALSIPALYALGRYAYGPRVGLFAAFLFTFSPFMMWYGSEVRMYTLLVFMAILHQYFYLRIIKQGDAYAWIGYALTAFVGIFVHYFFFLILGTEAVFYFMRRDLFPQHALRNFIAIAVGTLLLMAPWVWYVFHLGQAANQEPLLAPPTTVNLFGVFAEFLFGFQVNPINTVLLSLWPLVFIFAFLALRKGSSGRAETGFFVLALILPVAVAFLISFVIPLFVSRYLIFVAPTLYILIARVFSRYPSGVRWASGIALGVLMLFMMNVEVTNAMTPVKEDYRDVVAYLTAHASAQDVIIVSAPFTIYPIDYYYRGPDQLYTLPEWNRYATGAIPPFNAATLPTQVQQETQNAAHVWVVLSYNQGYEDKIKHYFDTHYARMYAHTFSPDLSLYEYRVSYAH